MKLASPPPRAGPVLHSLRDRPTHLTTGWVNLTQSKIRLKIFNPHLTKVSALIIYAQRPILPVAIAPVDMALARMCMVKGIYLWEKRIQHMHQACAYYESPPIYRDDALWESHFQEA